jgi:DNA repair protein SbcD/Mre11
MKYRFIHAADVHLDSPLASLRRLSTATADELQGASRRSLQTLIEHALEHRVQAVVIAGDLFDGPVKDVGAGLWVDSQFKRLTREGIKIVLIRGNHDAISNARRILRWSDGIHELPADSPATIRMDDCGLALHGQSFGTRSETSDLTLSYPPALQGYFNVGVLHTSLAGSPQHDVYAPTSVSSLESRGYDYWALGHIHLRSQASHSSQCYIGFSGNMQGRHIREQGAKGCQLVTVEDGRLQSNIFLPTDSLRWHEVLLDLQMLEHLGDIEDLLEAKVVPLLDSGAAHSLAVRLTLQGSTCLHGDLTRPSTIDRLSDACSERLNEIGPIWLESIKVQTHPAKQSTVADLDLPLKYVTQIALELQNDEAAQAELREALDELLRRARSELCEFGWPLVKAEMEKQEMNRLLDRAADLVVSRLISGT